MRKQAVVRIVLCVCAIGLLAGLLVAGILWSGKGLNLGLGLGGYRLKDADSYAVGNARVSGKGVTALSVDWVDGSVSIRVGDGDDIVVEEPEGLPEQDQLRWKVQDGELKIAYCRPYWFFGIHVKTQPKNLVVTIPAQCLQNLRQLEIDAVSAEVTVEQVKAAELSVETVSGSVMLSDCRADTLSLDSVSGSTTFVGAVRRLETETVSGNIDLTLDEEPERVEVSAVSGSVVLTLPEKASFTATWDTVSGSFHCERATVTENNHYICGEGRASLSFDTVSGDVSIR